MKELIKFEHRKIWNKVTSFAVVALFILSTLHTFIYLNLQMNTIDKNGEIIHGLKSYRALKEASKELEGVMDEEYLHGLIKKYDSSFDKKYLEEHLGYLSTGGMTKYMLSNYPINYAYFGIDMTNGNEKIGLDYDFLNSEESFYRKFKEAVSESIELNNEWNGLFKYSDEQMDILNQKIEKVKTPFRVEYKQGLANIFNWFNLEYFVFYIVLAFTLSSVYSKGSVSGIDELILSSPLGRKEDMKARWVAGNIFTVLAYLIFIGTIILEHGLIASLHGWNASVQTFWHNCLYNINIGTALVIHLAGGLLGALVMANFVMFLSIKTKNVKVATIISIVSVQLLVKLSGTYNPLKRLSPLHFKSSDLICDIYFFVGNTAIPYFVIAIVLGILYIGTFRWLMGRSFKGYHIRNT